MTQSRRELRLQRETSSPLQENEIVLHPEVLRAVAKKMRERRAFPDPMMKAKDYILATVYHDFVDALDAVADDTEEKAVKFIRQRDTDGTEGSDRI